MFRTSIFALALLTAAPAFGQQKFDNQPIETKEQAHARMAVLQEQLAGLRLANAPLRQIDRLQSELDGLSQWLGGDLPANSGNGMQTATALSGVQLLSAPTCSATSTTNFPGTGGTILPAPPVITPLVLTTSVSGVGTFLWDLNLNTTITHTACGDLDITLTSPAGTTITVTTDNGGTNDNVFNGTVWDEAVTGLLNTAADRTYANNVTSTPLNPEGRFEAFRGEDPNGTWTLTVTDDTTANTGSVVAWSLDVVTSDAPVEATTNFTQSPAILIPTGAPTTTTGPCVPAVMAVAGLGTYMTSFTMYTEITHTFVNDLDMTLTTPAGTVLKVSTDAGLGEDNVYNGTTFTGDFTVALTDAVFVNNVVMVTASFEGASESLRGQDPNGNWTLNITDDASGDVGLLSRWDLDIKTATAPTTAGPTNFAGTTGPIPDFPPASPVTPTIFTTAVAGVGTYLWDVDLTTAIAHTAGADIDMTLTSPAGTVVKMTTDNGGTNDDVFNGTLWDDNSTDRVTDHVYANATLASPLSPEGRLTAFRGEDPNGIWTLTITDDVAGSDFGNLGSWSLDVSTLASAPGTVNGLFSNSPALVIPSTAPPVQVTDTIAASGLPLGIVEVEVSVTITHTWNADLNISLTSPAGTTTALTTANGGSNDNVFNGTLFDADALVVLTDHTFANNVAVPLASPEGSLGVFDGEDPNGNWVLTIDDTANGDGGILHTWSVSITTCPNNGNSICSNGTLGLDHTTACPCGNVGAADRGCAHSFDANGALLDASGSIAADTVILHSSFEPAASFTLFMQHNAPGDTVFHDGVLCAGGTLTRLRGRNAGVTQFQPPGEAIFPNSNFANDATLTLSSRGGTFPGSGATMFYAAFYRNASTTFCPPATANVTNGWTITW